MNPTMSTAPSVKSTSDIDIYIETERPAKLDSQGIALVRDACVLVIDGQRFNFGGHADRAAAAIANAAAAAAYLLGRSEGYDDGYSAGYDDGYGAGYDAAISTLQRALASDQGEY